jgi:heat shock protein HtpX
MWSLIRANQRRSALLMLGLALLLGAFGFVLGGALDPQAAPLGLAIALGVWIVLLLVSVSAGEQLLLSQAGAREIERADAPQLWNIVEEMQLASGLPVMPRVFIVDDPAPNAFAVGLSPRRAAVAATTGLLARLNRDELQGVIAHEMGHIANRDTLFMTLAGTTLGAIVMLSDFYLRGLRWGGFRGRSRSSKSDGQAAALMAILALVMALLAPLLAQLLYFACSRRREYLADASSAQFTRYPEGLASALVKIREGVAAAPAREDTHRSRVLAPMYIVNPVSAAGGGSGLFGTHPPVEDRIRVLRSLTGDCSLAAYEAAYRSTHGGQGAGLGVVAAAPVAIRAGGEEPAAGWRQAKDVVHHLNAMRDIPCACGAVLRLPPDWPHARARCPRCGAEHPLPV